MCDQDRKKLRQPQYPSYYLVSIIIMSDFVINSKFSDAQGYEAIEGEQNKLVT